MTDKPPLSPARLETILDYRFRNPGLLLQALTHKSFVNERGAEGLAPGAGAGHNERLEFLGDAVLELAVSELLYRRQPGWDEGELTRMRSRVVNARALAGMARKLGLGDFLRLGRGEEKQGGRQRPALLADAFEALLAALHLDGGREVVARLAGELVADCRQDADCKSELQEYLQANGGVLPIYRLVRRQGADHQPLFEVAVEDGRGRELGVGRGTSRKKAEQAAAAAALQRLSPAGG